MEVVVLGIINTKSSLWSCRRRRVSDEESLAKAAEPKRGRETGSHCPVAYTTKSSDASLGPGNRHANTRPAHHNNINNCVIGESEESRRETDLRTLSRGTVQP